ncbi:Uncharacterised protein [Legionella busanensis]|uniref:Autotransporter domain-containing protein n=2 Tax=Legionella busanensis TaxID=190655 RepID=A0A378JM62_9GAMM|nr:Uncharacterised protein [Legionella busanensis]
MTRTIFLFMLLLSAFVYAENKHPVNQIQYETIEPLKQQYIRPRAIINTAYDDFKFSSRKGALFNNYSGHNRYIAVGGDDLNFGDYLAGFNFFNIRTNNTTWSHLNVSLSQSSLAIENNGLYVHVMKQIFSPLFIDVFASYGQNKFKLDNTVYGNTIDPLPGYSQYSGTNSLAGIRTFFGYAYQHFYLQGDLTYFYSNFHQRTYNIIYPNQNTIVPALTSRIGTFLENARLYYQVNEYFSPFISGGLVQLASRNYSRRLIDQNLALISSLPQLLIGRTGYRIGAGFNFNYKLLRITPTYFYSERSHNFKDNYAGITFEFIGV